MNATDLLRCPPLVHRAQAEPPRLRPGKASWWEEVREVLLDPVPDGWELEMVRRWLRDEVERELLERLRRGRAAGLVRWACRLAPRMIWKLPFSRADPPQRTHRRLVAVLLPHKLRQVERELTRHAFRQGLR